jgi:hypothetical protein
MSSDLPFFDAHVVSDKWLDMPLSLAFFSARRRIAAIRLYDGNGDTLRARAKMATC